VNIHENVNPELIWRHIQRITEIRHPDTHPEGLRKTLTYLREVYISLGIQIEEDPFDQLGVQYPNLIGVLPGKKHREEVFMIGAHYDTVAVSPGADDNASGLAVMLETCRVLHGVTPPCTIEFVSFSMEEDGLQGSRSYAKKARALEKKVLGAIILECVGYAVGEAGSQRSPSGLPIAIPDVGNFIGIIANSASQTLCRAFEGVVSAHVPKLPKVSLVVPENGERFPDTRRSDHASFWDQGFQALMLTDTADYRNPHYHQPTDLPETLDMLFMSSISQALVAFLAELGSFAQR
jgi:aminopeptidase YwaD